MPAAAGVPFQIAKTVGGLAKTTEEGTNVLPAFARSVEEINAATTGMKGLSNVNRVETAIKNNKLQPVGFNRSSGAEKETKIKYAAENNPPELRITSPAEKTDNLINITGPRDIIGEFRRDFSYPIVLVAGETSASNATQYFFNDLAEGLQAYAQNDFFLVTNPPTAEEFIGMKNNSLVRNPEKHIIYITARDYVPEINKGVLNLLSQPIYVLPTEQAYYETGAQVAHVLLVLGGKEDTVRHFISAVKNKNRIFIFNNPDLGPVNWDAANNRPGNAAAYLVEQIKAFKAGKPLPYPETAGFGQAFLEQNRDQIDLVGYTPYFNRDAENFILTTDLQAFREFNTYLFF